MQKEISLQENNDLFNTMRELTLIELQEVSGGEVKSISQKFLKPMMMYIPEDPIHNPRFRPLNNVE